MSASREPPTRRGVGIQFKLFGFTALVLMANILFLLLLGSTTFERLYVNEKVQDLKSGALRIVTAYQDYGLDSDEFSSALAEVENQNIVVRVFHRDASGEIVADYYSRNGFGPLDSRPEKEQKRFLIDFLTDFYKSGALNELESNKYLLQGDESGGSFSEHPMNNTIVLFTSLGSGVYLSLDTPRQFIAETAELAIKSCATIALFTLAFAAVALYLICRRIAAPITEIQRSAERIAELDFSARCIVRSRDEIGMLAQSINEMADSLQSNIRDLERANRLLRDDLHRTEQKDHMRKKFIANVSHDFKTPLTLITSYADSLRDLEDNQRELRDEYCEIIRSEGYKMTRQVQTLLNLSRLESGMVRLSLMDFPICEIINEAIHHYTILAQKRQLRIERELEGDMIVNADYQRIEQVIGNLLENALKYAQKGGVVRVSAKRAGGVCQVRIFNSGQSIDQDKQDKLFISFYRADESRGADGQSYGLGLAIVRSIMELHGQPYGVHNAPGGVEFWFHLPLSLADADEE